MLVSLQKRGDTMILKVKMIKPGYPFLQEKWINVSIDVREQCPEVDRLCSSGYSISDIKVIK